MASHLFDATVALTELRRVKRIGVRKPYQQSRLHRYRAELVALRKAGGSYRELKAWLRAQRVKVSHTTVMRYLAQLPEMTQEVKDAELS